jgi:hypothetical protein
VNDAAGVSWGFGGIRRREPEGGPWAGGSVSWRAAPSGFKEVARRTLSRTAGANGADTRVAPVGCWRRHATLARMEVANGARRRAARSPLKATRGTASSTAAASAASTRAASSLLEAIRSTSDELTVLYSNGPDDRSVKLALGYVTAATSGC